MKQTYFFIKRIIKKINNFNNYYQIPRYAASISFYMLISIVSVFLLAIQILTLSELKLDTFLIPKIIEIFSENFSEVLINVIPGFRFSGLSIILFFNLFFGASKTISGFDRICDYIYLKKKVRSGIKDRLLALLMFMMLLIVILFELGIILFSNYLIIEVLKIKYLFLIKFLQMIIELLVLFTSFLILLTYSPPVKMRFSNAYKGAIFSSISIYLLLSIFVLVINLMSKLGIAYTVITIISLSLSVLYYANNLLIIAVIINYKKMNNGNIFQLEDNTFER